MAARYVPPVWCSCGVDGEHLAPFGPVCASTAGSAAVLSPLVATPQAPQRASSHRTARTEQRSFAIATPLGPTTRFAIR